MQLDEAPCQGQAEARPLLLAGVAAAHLAELLEHRGLVFRRDADARVVHRDHEFAICTSRAHIDTATVRRELDSVGQQVEQDLLEFALVGDDLHERSIDLLAQ